MNKKIILAILAVILIVIIASIIIQNKNNKSAIEDTQVKLDITAAGGAPSPSDSAYSKNGWDKVPDLEQLKSLMGEYYGAAIDSINLIEKENSYWARIGYFAKQPDDFSSSTSNKEPSLSYTFFEYQKKTKEWVEHKRTEIDKTILNSLESNKN